MGMFDDLEIEEYVSLVPFGFRLSTYQTKDLDCDMSAYRLTNANLLLKIESFIGKPEKLFHSKNLNQDIACHDFFKKDKKLVLHVRKGIVESATLNSNDANYWDGINPVWDELLLNKN